jgi:hypothetical protein
MMARPWVIVSVGVAVLAGCRGSRRAVAQTEDERQLSALVDSLMPAVSAATGLAFKTTPRSAIRSHEQIRAYLAAKVDRDLPPERLAGIDDVFRLLHLVPDTLDLRRLFVDLYAEQIAGFFDPDSTTLFAAAGADPTTLRLVLAHELVHALQDEYVPLDSILHDTTDADRLTAAQAILEGQATLASLEALFPGADLVGNDAFWTTVKQQLKTQQFSASVFGRAPLVIRESLIFPYIGGSDFLRWFDRTYTDQQPFGVRMPESTEQIMHPSRYARGDVPLVVRFVDDTTGVLFEDTFGAFDIDVLRAVLAGRTDVPTDSAIGWGGDRLRVYRSPAGPALVWVTIWDAPADAGGFATTVAGPLERRPRPGYRVGVDSVQVGTRLGTRVVIAPVGWTGWKRLPGVTVRQER